MDYLGNASANPPQYAITTIGGVETFNAVNSYDFELPEHYLEELVIEIAQMAGVNLRDQFVSTIAQGEQNERSKEMVCEQRKIPGEERDILLKE